MKKEELRQRIIETALALSKANTDFDRELIKTYLDYYVDLALKIYKSDSEKQIAVYRDWETK